MSDKLVSPSSGLSNSDLAKANAGTGDVIAGKTFYAGDKNLKTGTIEEREAYTDVSDIVYMNQTALVRIPFGAYRTPTIAGKPEIRIPIDNVKNALPGGNQGAWSTTINPGASVTIPKGFHNGSGRVTANNVQSQLKTASFNLSLFSGGVAYGEILEKWWSPGGTVIGMTKCQIRTDTESGNSSANWTRCTVENGQVHFVNSFTHRGGNAYAEGTVVFI